jgi:hypothetical protein
LGANGHIGYRGRRRSRARGEVPLVTPIDEAIKPENVIPV